MPGGRARSASKELKKMSPNKAWIISPDNQTEYNTALLMNGDKVRILCKFDCERGRHTDRV